MTYRVWSFWGESIDAVVSQWDEDPEWTYREGDFGALYSTGYFTEGRETYDFQNHVRPPAWLTLDIWYYPQGANGDPDVVNIGLSNIAQTVTAAPEPTSLILLISGLSGLAAAARKHRRQKGVA